MILDVYPLRRLGGPLGWWSEPARRVYVEKIPFVLLAAAASALAVRAQSLVHSMAPLDQLSVPARLAVSAYGLSFYLWKMIVPSNLSPLYPRPLTVDPWAMPFVLSYGLVLATTGIALALRRRVPGLSAAWSAYVVVLLPVLGIVQIGSQLAADRYTYLAGLGWAILAGAGLSSCWRISKSTGTPIALPLAVALAHPGANITGFTTFEFSMGTKWLDLLKGIAPKLARVAVMQYAKSPTWSGQLQAIEAAAPSLGTQIIPAGVENVADIERSIAEIAREADGGLIVLPDSITLIHRKLIVSLTEQYRLPAIYPFRYFTDDGGLISYGIDLADVWRRSATYVDRILKGSAAGDLPVQQPTKFELVVNLKTAKALGLEIPPAMLARADEVIE